MDTEKEVCSIIPEEDEVNTTNATQKTLLRVFKEAFDYINALLENCGGTIPDKIHEIEEKIAQDVALLLDQGANPNFRDSLGRTLLHYIAFQEVRFGYSAMEKTARVLLRHGAEVHTSCADIIGSTPLSLALVNCNRGLTGLFLQFEAFCFCKESDRRFLHIASKKGYAECFEILLRLGADIDAVDVNGLTTLHFACGAESSELVINLLEYGCDVDAVSKGKYAFRAIEVAEGKIMRVILEHLIKLRSAGFSVYIGKKEEVYRRRISKLTQQCQRELEIMKRKKICDTNVSFRDVLTENVDELAGYAKNDELVSFLTSQECRKRFQRYGSVLKGCIWRGIVRNQLLQKSTEVFSECFDGHLVLPDICVEKILRYLSNNELRTFIRWHLRSKQSEKQLYKMLVSSEKDLDKEDKEWKNG